MTGYGKRRIVWFGLELLERYGKASPATAEILSWLETANSQLEINLPEELDDAPRTRRGGVKLGSRAWAGLIRSMEKRLAELRNSRPGRFEMNIREVGKSLGLSRKELLLLEFYCRVEKDEGNLDYLHRELVTDGGCDPFELVAIWAGISRGEALKLLGMTSKLIRMGLLTYEHSVDRRFSVPNQFLLALLPPNRGLGDFRERILGGCVPAELSWEDFEHVGASRELVFSLLKGALKTRATGINILLYGPSGTGKTEFCKTVAAELGLALHSVGETDEDGTEPTRRERIAQLRMAEHLAGKDTLLLFDEMEDLLDSVDFLGMRRRSRSGSKVFGHRLLEMNRIPVIWTSNDIDSFDPALLRRMTAAVEFRKPPMTVRRKIWEKVLSAHNVPVSHEELGTLAKKYQVAPGVAANAAKVGGLTGKGLEHVQLTVELMHKAMGGKKQARDESRPDFYPDLTRTDQDLECVRKGIVASGRMDFSLLLSGPPGSGKSLFARYMAESLGLSVVQKRASDLLDMFVGQTEKAIAAAFEEARQEKALLIFDEADSLLQDRAGAFQSWEVTQVNEMLTWMESHPYPFVCTTNLYENLDPASMRRFTFKISFDYLKREQLGKAFDRFFAMPAPLEVFELEKLTPADFALVRKKAEFLGCTSDAVRLVDMLRAEARTGGKEGMPIGFGCRSSQK